MCNLTQVHVYDFRNDILLEMLAFLSLSDLNWFPALMHNVDFCRPTSLRVIQAHVRGTSQNQASWNTSAMSIKMLLFELWDCVIPLFSMVYQYKEVFLGS